MTMFLKHAWRAGMLLAIVSTGCKAGGGISTPFSGGGGSTSSGDSSGGTGDTGAGAPSCANPADHCLEAGDLLVSEPFEQGYVSAHVGKQTAPPNAAGEATFMMLGDGSTKTSRVAYKSHRAAPQEIVIGTLVAAFDHSGSNNVYTAPTSRQDVMQGAWFVARIVSVDPVAQGHVVVSNGYKVSTDNLRVVEGDDGPRLQAPGAEDATFVKPEHWMVGDSALPATGYTATHLALAIQPPSDKTRNEGEFLITQTGARKWTKNAWRTRAATAGDVKVGAYVFAFDASGSDNVYRAPQDRIEALNGNWFVAKVTDTGEAFKGVVTVSGGYRVAIKGLRVPAN